MQLIVSDRGVVMRNIPKSGIPTILDEHQTEWTDAYMADPSETNRNRYRDPAIKEALMEETHDKCAYCESKLGHNCPGDVEHKAPVCRRPDLLFAWSNMTIACSVCNTKKGRYYSQTCPLLDPNEDDVEACLMHLGPLILPVPGDSRAAATLRQLKLDLPNERPELIGRKFERLEQVRHLVDRIKLEQNNEVRQLFVEELNEQCSRSAEFSAMIKSYVDALPGDWLDEEEVA